MTKKLLFAVLTCSTTLLSAQDNVLSAQATCDATVYPNGYATFYTLLETGASSVVKCSFDVTEVKGGQYGALHQTMLNETPAKWCGACVSMTGSAGTSTIQIVDECPTCTHSTQDIDLSPAAFAAIVGDQSIGVENVSWKEVPCPWSTPLYVLVEGSNQWYAKVIIGNHVNRIANVEVKQGSTYYALKRGTDNGWASTGSPAEGMINEVSKTFRITDIFGEQIIVSGISFSANPTNSKTSASSNFTACTLTETEKIKSIDYISIYPNPASDLITMEGLEDVSSIDVISTLGNIVASQTLNGNTSSINLDVSTLAAGIYVVKFADVNGQVSAQTIVVK